MNAWMDGGKEGGRKRGREGGTEGGREPEEKGTFVTKLGIFCNVLRELL